MLVRVVFSVTTVFSIIWLRKSHLPSASEANKWQTVSLSTNIKSAKIASDVHNQIENVKSIEFFGIQFDESTDVSNIYNTNAIGQFGLE